MDKPLLVDAEFVDELRAGARQKAVECSARAPLLSQVSKAVLERALTEDMSQHLAMTRSPSAR